MHADHVVHLSVFIQNHMEPILKEWEEFARTIEPTQGAMDSNALRDHAAQMLMTIVADLDTPQSAREQSEKSKGRGQQESFETAAQTHVAQRMSSGFSIEQVAAEFRALRASVLRLWVTESGMGLSIKPEEIIRFNEAIDQALSESIMRYAKLVKQSQNMFLAILGHDLLNPIGTTITGATYLMEASEIDSQYTGVATRIRISGERMHRLVSDLIDYTRTHLGSGLPVAPRQTNIGRICQNIVDEMRTFHPERTIELTADGQLDGLWDEDRMAQALSNLIGNALEYGSKCHPVALKVFPDDADVIVTVNNQGPPIAEENLESIFDPLVRFTQDEKLDCYSPEASLGLGLYIAREVVNAHGGSINVYSSPKDGTTFAIRLPRTSSWQGEDQHIKRLGF
jgi:signal transduction histidine kinase